MSGRSLAAFDFDGTLTRRDTLLPFLRAICGGRAFARAVARAGSVDLRSRAGRGNPTHHRDAAKAVLLRTLLAGREAAWLAERGSSHAEGLASRLRPEMLSRLAWHRECGHELVIVSASLDAYLAPFGARYGFAHVIAVELAVDDAGLLTGEMSGPNVRGPEKAVRLDHWLGAKRPDRLWAYGNSSGDRELLAMADVATWVNRRSERTTLGAPPVTK